MITRENKLYIEEFDSSFALLFEDRKDIYKNALFFDLEHYVYKKPVCIGVFGCAYYDEAERCLLVTQYMIQNNKESHDILVLAKEYFRRMLKMNKKYIVTFSGNNDYTVINYLFDKYKMNFNLEEKFTGIDLQKEYEKIKKTSIGLKALEKEFGIIREGDLISGSNLAKTISKIIKDEDYMNRMPVEKKEKILVYNEQDVVSLFHMYINWDNIIKFVEETIEIVEENVETVDETKDPIEE